MAVTLTADVLAGAIGADRETADRLLPVASALVERHAPNAPEAVQNEAAIRCAGWLAQAPSSGLRHYQIGAAISTFTPSMTSAVRHSGAAGLLSPWKVRRAGAV